MGTTVQRLFSAGLAPATRRNYGTRERRYLAFCQQFNVTTPFPVTEHVLAAFVAFLFGQKLAAGSVKNYLAAVWHAQIALGFVDPHMGSMPQLEYMVRGLKRLAAPASRQQHLPATPPILRGFEAGVVSSPGQVGRDNAVGSLNLVFFGFLRLWCPAIPIMTVSSTSRSGM